jgi:hypothetical protein
LYAAPASADPVLNPAPIQRSAWKGDSPNFAMRGICS